MLQILGLNIDSPYWTDHGIDQRLRDVVDGLVAELLAQRAGSPRAQGLRRRRRYSRLPGLLGRRGLRHPGRSPLGDPLMPGNSQRKGAVRRKGKGNTAGSGGRVRRGLEGKGPTPKAEDRPYHSAYRAKRSGPAPTARRSSNSARTGRPGAGPEWVAGRNAVLEAMAAGIPEQGRVRRRGG